MDTDMHFVSFLASKNIDAEAFKNSDPALYTEWESLFLQIHPASFTLQKKFMINPIRRKYQLEKK